MNIAINGLGRIGRNTLRALLSSEYNSKFKLVAVNNLSDIDSIVHMLKYDSVHGRLDFDVSVNGDTISVAGQTIKYLSISNPADLPWADLGVDCVLECSGVFNSRDKASLHLKAGAKKVLLSAPSNDADLVAVYGVNHEQLSDDLQIVSNASCTTNCLAPITKVLNDSLGIENGFVNTTHSYTNDQNLIDSDHSDLRRARAASVSMIPSKTGAAKMIGMVIPELNNKLDGLAIRVPTPNVSIIDFTFNAKRSTSKEEVNQILTDASNNELKGILCASNEPLVSADFIGDSHSSIADLALTYVCDNLVKVMSWYDNEWGYSNRMLDVCNHWLNN